ncbi:MAG: efflux RND transporter periplasmic adaptor subunit, partial [Pirellulales bacterium]|nr:efflux RND transporter periplasmic adaptor subunit [Pirellulales bacterium]
ASIAENRVKNIEQTALDQAWQFVKSMKNTVQAALARVEAGEAQVDYAKKHFERVKALAKSSTLSEEDLDRATLDLIKSGVESRQDKLVHAAMVAMEKATNLLPKMIQQQMDNKAFREKVLEKEKAEATARLERIRENQVRGQMTSPVDGVVLERFVQSERFLSAGTNLLEIGRLEDLEVEADVLSLDVVNVKEGDPVLIVGPAVGKKPAHGTVKKIYPAGFTKVSSLGVEQQRVKVIIELNKEDLARLLDERHIEVGYRVRVEITTAEKPDALVIPRTALFRGTDNQWQVYAVRGGRTVLQTVQVGLMNDRQAEVTKGLEAGERVIVAPENSLREGQRVAAAGG